MNLVSNKSGNISVSKILLISVEPAALLYFISLMYKWQVLGLFCMAVMAVSGFLIRRPIRILDNQVAVFTVLYIFMATVTAFLVDFKDGLYRTTQFTLLVFAMFGLIKFWYLSSLEVKERFIKRLVVVTVLIFVHMIIYHVLIGRLTTWKYLSDTKTTISILVVILFSYLTSLKMKIGTFGTLFLIGFVGILVLVSGERKAYLLMGILFLLSIIPLKLKLAIGLTVGILISLFLISTPDGSYVNRQLSSAIGLSEQSADAYDNYRHRDLETIRDLGFRSDLIRKYVNANARSLFLDNPILGLGSGGYRSWAKARYGVEYNQQISGIRTNVHGEINRIPAESGLLGILISGYCFTLFFIFAVKLVFSKIRNDKVNSKVFFPLYYLIFITVYCMYEAMDTNMLTLVLCFGLFLSMEVKSNRKISEL